jgi:hypothetical protein
MTNLEHLAQLMHDTDWHKANASHSWPCAIAGHLEYYRRVASEYAAAFVSEPAEQLAADAILAAEVVVAADLWDTVHPAQITALRTALSKVPRDWVQARLSDDVPSATRPETDAGGVETP